MNKEELVGKKFQTKYSDIIYTVIKYGNIYKLGYKENKISDSTFTSDEIVESFNNKSWIEIKEKKDMKINTSLGVIEIKEEDFNFDAEKFEYDQTKYPEFAKTLAKIFPAFRNIYLDNNYLKLKLESEYYGIPEYYLGEIDLKNQLDPIQNTNYTGRSVEIGNVTDRDVASKIGGPVEDVKNKISDDQLRELALNMKQIIYGKVFNDLLDKVLREGGYYEQTQETQASQAEIPAILPQGTIITSSAESSWTNQSAEQFRQMWTQEADRQFIPTGSDIPRDSGQTAIISSNNVDLPFPE